MTTNSIRGGPAIARMNDLMDDEAMPLRQTLIAVLEDHAKLDEAIRAFPGEDDVSRKLIASAARLMCSDMAMSRDIHGKVLRALKDGWRVRWEFDEDENPDQWGFDPVPNDAERTLVVTVHAPKAQQCRESDLVEPEPPA
jgi:hypothetical protein